MNMKLLCVAVLVCLAVVFAEAKSVRSKKEKEETALKRVLAAVKEVKLYFKKLHKNLVPT